MFHNIVLGTRNRGKLREIRQILRRLEVRVTPLDEWPRVEEPEETGATFAENARAKALYYARALRGPDGPGPWCLADDSGLEVGALGGAPGVHSARYALGSTRGKEVPDRKTADRKNNAKLLEELGSVPDEKRTARFICHLALADAEKILLEARGKVEGRIGRVPAGQNGFGYDPLFFVPSLGCTTAQLCTEEKNRISHRGKAVRQFAKLLKEYLKEDG